MNIIGIYERFQLLTFYVNMLMTAVNARNVVSLTFIKSVDEVKDKDTHNAIEFTHA